MIAVYKREFKSYFYSMIGYVYVAFLIMFTGIYFLAYNLNAGYPYFAYALSGCLIVFLVAIPVLTMKSFAEERRNKTDQVLLTAPVSLSRIVMGKYFAMVTVLAIPDVIFCLFPLIIKSQGKAYLAVDYVSIFAFFLLGCVYVAIGMFISSLTESQIIAAIGTFGILLALYLWSGILQFMPGSAAGGFAGILILLTIAVIYIYRMTGNWFISAVLEGIGAVAAVIIYVVKSSLYENLLTNLLSKFVLTSTFTNIADSGLADVSGFVFYLSLIIVFVFLTVQSIQKRRWS